MGEENTNDNYKLIVIIIMKYSKITCMKSLINYSKIYLLKICLLGLRTCTCIMHVHCMYK